jgi:hypothetical protein
VLHAEQEAKSQRVDRLVLLTTRTADWFEQRGFQHAGPAHASPFLPETRRQQVSNCCWQLHCELLAASCAVLYIGSAQDKKLCLFRLKLEMKVRALCDAGQSSAQLSIVCEELE